MDLQTIRPIIEEESSELIGSTGSAPSLLAAGSRVSHPKTAARGGKVGRGDCTRRLIVLDMRSMVSLYDKTWKWNVETSAEAVSTMIQTFYQFSREVDEGGECL